jgi:[protein-PII] uridylyltransferase
MDQLGLNIQDARIITSRDGMVLDTFIVLEEEGETIPDAHRIDEIAGLLKAKLAETGGPPGPVSRRTQRRLKHFAVPTEIGFRDDPAGRTVMQVVTTDRPGLLARIGVAMGICEVALHNARIATFGERVEDFFYVTDRRGEPLDATSRERLRQEVTRALAD